MCGAWKISYGNVTCAWQKGKSKNKTICSLFIFFLWVCVIRVMLCQRGCLSGHKGTGLFSNVGIYFVSVGSFKCLFFSVLRLVGIFGIVKMDLYVEGS